MSLPISTEVNGYGQPAIMNAGFDIFESMGFTIGHNRHRSRQWRPFVPGHWRVVGDVADFASVGSFHAGTSHVPTRIDRATHHHCGG